MTSLGFVSDEPPALVVPPPLAPPSPPVPAVPESVPPFAFEAAPVPLPPWPPVPAVPAAPPVPVVVVFFTHSPALQTCPVGHFTASHGSLPQAPVVGSQYEPSLHTGSPAFVVHLLGPHAPPASPPFERQYCPLGQSVAHPVGLQLPSTQCSPVLHVTVAQLPTQRWSLKVVFGTHASFAPHGFGSHGSSTHLPLAHAFPLAQPKNRQSPTGRHSPANAPVGTQVRPGSQFVTL
jgi:hypothetical protein